MGDPRSWGDDPEVFDALLEEHGAEPLPDVDARLPALARGPAQALGPPTNPDPGQLPVVEKCW